MPPGEGPCSVAGCDRDSSRRPSFRVQPSSQSPRSLSCTATTTSAFRDGSRSARREVSASAPAPRTARGRDRIQEHSPVAVTNPRAIAGDHVEPAWDEMLTITVGQKDADLVGTTDKVDPGRGRLSRPSAGAERSASCREPIGSATPSTCRRGSGIKGERPRDHPDQGALDDHQAGGRLRLVRPGNHAGRRPRVPARRRRLPESQEPGQRRSTS